MGKKYKNGLLRQPPSLLIGKHGPIIANTIARSLLLEAKTVEVQHLKDGSVDGYAKERNQRRSADGILFSLVLIFTLLVEATAATSPIRLLRNKAAVEIVFD